jgi:hypothetical protein
MTTGQHAIPKSAASEMGAGRANMGYGHDGPNAFMGALQTVDCLGWTGMVGSDVVRC